MEKIIKYIELLDTNNYYVDQSIFDDSYLTVDISNNLKRQEFENNMTILMVIDFFSYLNNTNTNTDYNFDKIIKLTERTTLINFIKQFQIPENLISWIKENMPTKLIKKIKYPYIYPFEVEETFKKLYEDQYKKDYIRIFVDNTFNTIDQENKKKLVSYLYRNLIEELKIKDIYTKSEEINNMLSNYAKRELELFYLKKNFFGYIIQNPTHKNKIDTLLGKPIFTLSLEYLLNYSFLTCLKDVFNFDTKTEIEIDNILTSYGKTELNNNYLVKNIFGYVTHYPTREDKIRFIMLLSLSELKKSLILDYQIEHLILNKMNNDKQFLFDTIYNLAPTHYQYVKLFYMNFNTNKNDIATLKNLEKEYKNKIYIDITPEENLDISYYLNFEDHWVLYDKYPDKYMEFITSYLIIKTPTICNYLHSDYTFLQHYNKNVQQNIINKINSDNKHIIIKPFLLKDADIVNIIYGKINSLSDAVDISVFFQDPPNFINTYNYSSKNNLFLQNILVKLNYDMNKLSYKNYNLKLTYELIDESKTKLN